MDKEQIQQHVEKVGMELSNANNLTGYARIAAITSIEFQAQEWLQQSLSIIEHQQREIAAIEEDRNKAWSIVESLTKSSGESPDPGDMTYNDRFQLECLIKEFGAGFILDYVNQYAYANKEDTVND